MILNKNKRTVSEQRIFNKTQPFEQQEKSYCPECNEELIEKAGKIKVWHFAHKCESNCQYGAGMSEWHQLQQLMHHENGWNIEENILLSGETFRLDAYMEINGEKFAREFIHTFCDEYHHKNEMLKNHGYDVEWIVDPDATNIDTEKNFSNKSLLNARTILNNSFTYISKLDKEITVNTDYETYLTDVYFFKRNIHNYHINIFKKQQEEIDRQKTNNRMLADELYKKNSFMADKIKNTDIMKKELDSLILEESNLRDNLKIFYNQTQEYESMLSKIKYYNRQIVERKSEMLEKESELKNINSNIAIMLGNYNNLSDLITTYQNLRTEHDKLCVEHELAKPYRLFTDSTLIELIHYIKAMKCHLSLNKPAGYLNKIV